MKELVNILTPKYPKINSNVYPKESKCIAISLNSKVLQK